MKKTRISARQSKGFLRVIFFLGVVGMLVMPAIAYAEECHHLSVSAGEGGLVETTPANTYEFCNYGYGWEDVSIRAYPNPRYEQLGKKYEFVRFDIAEYDDNGNVSEKYTSDSSELTLTMDRDYDVAAIFEEVPAGEAGDEGYDLFSTKDEDKKATYTLIIDAPDGTTEPAPGAHTYDEGTTVVVEAYPPEDYYFVGWKSDPPVRDAGNRRIQIVMDSNKTITAMFIPKTFEITLGKDGDGEGSILIRPDKEEYLYNERVTLWAIPEEGSFFSHWECSETGYGREELEYRPRLTVIMDSNIHITAYFEDASHELGISATEGGTTEPEPGEYIIYREPIFGEWPIVRIKAIPFETDYERYRFVKWRLVPRASHPSEIVFYVPDYRTDNPLSLLMDENWDVEAIFEKIHILTITKEDGGSTDPAAGEYICKAGQVVSIQATPKEGFNFAGWEGDVSPQQKTENPIEIFMDRDRTIIPTFEPIMYQLNVIIQGEGEVSKEPPPVEIADGQPGGWYEYLTKVTLTATPGDGWTFVHWIERDDWMGEDIVISNSATIDVTMYKDRTIKARFFPRPIITVTGEGEGTITTDGEVVYPPSGEEILVDIGSSTTFDIKAAAGWKIYGVWENDVSKGGFGEETFSHTVSNVTWNRTLRVRFSPYCTLVITSSDGGNTYPREGTYEYFYGFGARETIKAIPISDLEDDDDPTDDYVFIGWDGAPEGHETDNPLALTMDRDYKIHAKFSKVTQIFSPAELEVKETPAPPADNDYSLFGSNYGSVLSVGSTSEELSDELDEPVESVDESEDEASLKDYQELQNLVASSYKGDIVEIEPGEYVFTSDLVIDKDVSLVAIDPENTTFVLGDHSIIIEEAEGEERIENVTIEGVTIRDHSGKAENGPIQNHAKNLTLSDCKVVDNKGLRASAVYTDYNTNLNLDNTLIADNTNTEENIEESNKISNWRRRFAGAVYLGGRAELNMTNSTIAGNTNESETSNKAVNYGAVQRSWLNDVNIDDSIMWDNEEGNDVSSMIKWFQKRYIINSNIQQNDIPGMGSLREVISVDPEFEDPANKDYDVKDDSLCGIRKIGLIKE